MKKNYIDYFRRLACCACLLCFSLYTVVAQTTLSSPVPSGLNYYSDTQPGVIVFGVKNNNATAITVTNLANYIEAGFSGNYTLWYHPTIATGVPTAISAANGWVETLTANVNPAVTAVTPIFSGLNIVIPPGTIYRFALQSPIHAPFYGTAGSTGDLFSYGGVEIFAQANANSPTYAGLFPGPPTLTPRSFYGSISFTVAPSAVANNASAYVITAPANFCPGNNDVKVKLLNNGNNVISTVQVNWEVDGVIQTPINYTTPIDVFGSTAGNEAIVTLGSVNFGAAAKNIRVWTSLPNGAADPIPGDDQTTASLRGKLIGTYTIGGGTPDFATFTEAAAALGAGICGPVTINVAPGSGPYNEQVIIPVISGTSATNTVTINGNGATLQFAPAVSADRHILRLDGADRVKITNLNITALSGATYGWGIHLINGANNNRISNCNINMSAVTSTAQSNSAGIVGSGSTTAVTTDGSYSNDTITNNIIIGAFQGIIINGTTGALNASNNIITNNNIEDFYANGIELTDNNGSIVANNGISRRARVAVTTFAGIEIGPGNLNVLVNANRIHDSHTSATTQSGTAYGIYLNACDATAGNENRITNNLIYDLNSLTGTIYGLYNSSSNGVFFYHNTVVLDNSASTAGITRGFYQLTLASNIEVKNNIIDIRRGGTGVKYCLYFGTTTSTIISNNNLLYNTSAAGTNGIGSFGTAGSATLAAWQAANGSIYDQASINIDPMYTAPGSGDFLPTASLADNKGMPVGVTTDFIAAARSATLPDIGAYEFTTATAGLNIAADGLVAPAVSASGCYSAANPVTVSIRNSSLFPLDFAVNPVTVTTNVTGAATQTLTATVNTGTLAPDAAVNINMTTPLDMTAAGTYTFNANVTMAGDVFTGNNAITPVSRTKINLSAGTPVATPPSYCIVAGKPTLIANGVAGFSGFQWQESRVAGSGFTDIAGATTTPFSVANNIAQTMYYRLVASCGVNSTTSAEMPVLLQSPAVTSVTPAARCGTGTVDLLATPSTGATINWYDAPTGGTILATGNTFTTPSIATTTNFYASAGSGVGGAATGLPVPTASPSSGAGTTNFGLVFDVLSPFRILSVVVYPVSTAGASGTVTIDVIDGSGTVVHTTSANVVGAPTASAQPQIIPLNFDMLPGTNYKMRPFFTGITGLLFDPAANAPSGNYGYPIVVPGVLSINHGTTSAAPTNTPRLDLYYYFYNWQIAVGCESPRTTVTATVDCTVPVKWLSFTGEKSGAVNTLEWRTATEINNSGFELQRSADGIRFGKLAFIPSKASGGNSNVVTAYNFDDVHPLITNGYYRLKQIDKDNKGSYSQVVLIKAARSSVLTIGNIYPNPVKDQLNLVVSAPQPQRISLVMYDVTGRMLQQKVLDVTVGDNYINLNTSKLPAGSYSIKAICNNGCNTALQKFVKQ